MIKDLSGQRVPRRLTSLPIERNDWDVTFGVGKQSVLQLVQRSNNDNEAKKPDTQKKCVFPTFP